MPKAKANANAKPKAKAKGVPKVKAKSKATRDPGPRSSARLTKKWLTTHRTILMELDWMSRHDLYDRLYRTMPIGCKTLASMFSPDELICGTKTGRPVRRGYVIKLENKDGWRKVQRQTLLTEYFTLVH